MYNGNALGTNTILVLLVAYNVVSHRPFSTLVPHRNEYFVNQQRDTYDGAIVRCEYLVKQISLMFW